MTEKKASKMGSRKRVPKDIASGSEIVENKVSGNGDGSIVDQKAAEEELRQNVKRSGL